MNGVDVISFTAGIGENAPIVRYKVLAYLGYLGIKWMRKQTAREAMIS